MICGVDLLAMLMKKNGGQTLVKWELVPSLVKDLLCKYMELWPFEPPSY